MSIKLNRRLTVGKTKEQIDAVRSSAGASKLFIKTLDEALQDIFNENLDEIMSAKSFHTRS